MKKILLTKSKFALVDDRDFEFLNQWKWFYENHGYAQRRVSKYGRMLGMHRVIMDEPEDKQVDHIDGNGLNNQRSNLRVATKAENLMNRGKNKNNTSGYKGVSWHKGAGKWTVNIMSYGKSVYIGLYPELIAAARAYNRAALKYHGEFARLNDA